MRDANFVIIETYLYIIAGIVGACCIGELLKWIGMI